MEEELDPRIQIELENLNTTTDQINKVEIELEEANSTFRILLNESTRRLKLSVKKLGSCIEKSRPYYDAIEKAKVAQVECQKAAVKYQRASEIHAAAKETVALAEQRFMSNSHEWQFDTAWQEMLNHATTKVMDAEKQKTDSGLEHQIMTLRFHQAESKVQQIEQKFKSSIHKSRPYFEEKQICNDQLQTQKERIQQLQAMLQSAKANYSSSLKSLEMISESIHKKRGDLHIAPPPGVRTPGVGAEEQSIEPAASVSSNKLKSPSPSVQRLPSPDYSYDLDKCELRSLDSHSVATSTTISLQDLTELSDFNEVVELQKRDKYDENDVETLRLKVKTLAVRPIESGDGQQEQQIWENELNATVDKLDHLMLIRECTTKNYILSQQQNSEANSLPDSPVKPAPIKMLQKADPLPLANVSLQLLPTSSPSNTFNLDNSNNLANGLEDPRDNLPVQQKRKLSLQ